MLTIQTTVDGFGWVANMLETVLSAEIWGMCTSATTAFAYRKRFEECQAIPKAMIPFMAHDFSYRGMFGTQAAAMSGFGHLTSFVGSDTIPAALFAEHYYGAHIDKELVFASVDATEHSVMASYGNEGELESLKHLMTDVTPTGILSVVSDTWDFWKLVTEYLPALKDLIMNRDGTLVIRPDSGDPVKILTGYTVYHPDTVTMLTSSCQECSVICGAIAGGFEAYKLDGKYFDTNTNEEIPECEAKGLVECLWETFGGTVTEDGLKMLDSHIGAIYGDSITLERQDQIINRLIAKKFVPTVVLGVGSYTYQYVTRDTHGFAMKATDMLLADGTHKPIFKAPKTDSKKSSAKGLLLVYMDVGGHYRLIENVSPEEESSVENCLRTVWVDGKLIRKTTLKEIRQRINENFEAR